ncbi:MAG TPA: hypothetical protein PK205_07250 [Promineifilum sp.]|nr:hypothetical protein [Promineifilum sp.]
MMKMHRTALMASVLALPAVFANANAGSRLFICTTPQQNDLTVPDYQALVWVEIKGVGNHGEIGANTNILTYDTWDTDVIQKAKGMTDAGSPEIELARIPTDAGQIALNAAAATNLNYAFRIVRNDVAFLGGDPTILYYRGLVAGPRYPLGRNEDFDLEIFTLGLNQKVLKSDPTAPTAAPVLTVAPAITGTAEVGETLTVSNGTFTGTGITYAYQWYAGGVAIVGATAGTYDLTAAELGKVITARVVATNAGGSATGFAAPTAAVTTP